jgi:hypothetical protein
MMAAALLRPLVARRLWIYGGGLLAIALSRTGSLPRTARTTVLGLALGLMILTYVGERVRARGLARPLVLVLGLVGLVGGVVLAIASALVGLAFAVGGMLFVEYALAGGDGR